MALGHWSRRSHERMCGFSKYASRRGAKSDRSLFGTFWHFWHLITLEVFEKHTTTYAT
jgi:hypothetical protein